MERYDIAIIGTGPAGLSAAVTAAIRKKKILLAGSRDLSSKVQKAQEIQNYLGFPDISGAELGKAFEEHIDRMQVPDCGGAGEPDLSYGRLFFPAGGTGHL